MACRHHYRLTLESIGECRCSTVYLLLRWWGTAEMCEWERSGRGRCCLSSFVCYFLVIYSSAIRKKALRTVKDKRWWRRKTKKNGFTVKWNWLEILTCRSGKDQHHSISSTLHPNKKRKQKKMQVAINWLDVFMHFRSFQPQKQWFSESTPTRWQKVANLRPRAQRWTIKKLTSIEFSASKDGRLRFTPTAHTFKKINNQNNNTFNQIRLIVHLSSALMYTFTPWR